jgi:hypothetical protein
MRSVIETYLNILTRTHGTGALIDDRVLDFPQFDEIVAGAEAVNWVEKPESQWRKFKEQNQAGSSSCVAQSTRKYMSILYKVNTGEDIDFSATDVYQRRKNFPKEGMYAVDALEIAGKGVTLNELVPSDFMTEQDMNTLEIADYKRDVGKIFKAGVPIILPTKDIDAVASVIQKTGKGVVLFFYFTNAEWSKTVPTINDISLSLYSVRAYRHGVVAVDFTLYNGKKALIIEDSAHFGGKSRRIITEDFYAKRNYFAGYTMNFTFVEGSDVPYNLRYTFTRDLAYTPRYTEDAEVAKLQDIMKHEGVFPITIDSTGWYGNITVQSVKKLEKKYGYPQTGVFSGNIRAFINKKYKA